MDGHQTLRDFVLELITDSQARAAFELDPEGSLQAAGLGDLTPADVQDVIPLVADLAPAQGIASPVQFAQNLGLDALPTDGAAAVSQLQHLAELLPVGAHSGNGDLNVATLGAFTAAPALSAFGGGLFAPAVVGTETTTTFGTGEGTVGLSSEHDVSGTLDADLTIPGLPATGPLPVGGDGGLLQPVQGTVGDVLDGNPLTSVVDGVGELPVLGTVTGELDSVLGGTGGLTGGLDGGVGGLLDGTVHGATEVTGDLGSTLGVGHLGLSGDAHAGGTGVLGLADGLL
ncbi:IniB N-terminal domain-containing protein [Catellatospora sichuanensis]|uniref:IniB N-terminal domain-containing protein n=1 Tax=Catellatospora sichuanensis TaxID=1969805 RepID=UPI001182EED5|nr:IniB N-terminal domain-containing protein [Catellatospora sichuanensis]